MVSRTLRRDGELVRARRPASSAASETAYVNAISPSIDDHREVDAVAPLELVVTVDRDAAQVEAEPRRLALEYGECAGAEPAAGALVEHDLDAASPATVKPSCRSLVTSSAETASITSR